MALDWRDNPLHPHAGGRYGVQFSDYHDQDLDAFSFRSVAVDLQQYVPIPDRYRTMALHAAAIFTDPATGQHVPVLLPADTGRRAGAARLPRVPLPGSQQPAGDARNTDGKRGGRSTARCSSMPARWPHAGGISGCSDFDVSYGVGFRIHSNSAFVARLDLAFSREGFIPLLRFEHAF